MENNLKMKDMILTYIIIGIIALLGNWAGYHVSPIKALPGMLIIVLITIVGWGIKKILPINLPAVIYISLIALLVTTKIFPGSEWITKETGNVNFLALATPILAYAGLSFGKDLNQFKKLGWRIVVISFVVYTGTFVISTIMAELSFRFIGKF
ncbi:hypothetical protein [Terrilactibacillus laevilacticus]|uniref:DUF340 domain-containing protein n=1 Tax=Terrilactibacillus laevilacticus TaxID=1380157 RepID=A0ABW5PV35_9BACI|nr:hypothetical protein [Terrilactibacillus laevilacticus]